MSPSDDGGLGLPNDYVVCRNCESRAYPSWSFCRNCEESLDDPISPEEFRADKDISPFDGENGCPKCGHAAATVDRIATTGTGVSRLLDLQNRSFTAIVCDHCSYTEFYSEDLRDEVLLDLFFG